MAELRLQCDVPTNAVVLVTWQSDEPMRYLLAGLVVTVRQCGHFKALLHCVGERVIVKGKPGYYGVSPLERNQPLILKPYPQRSKGALRDWEVFFIKPRLLFLLFVL